MSGLWQVGTIAREYDVKWTVADADKPSKRQVCLIELGTLCRKQFISLSLPSSPAVVPARIQSRKWRCLSSLSLAGTVLHYFLFLASKLPADPTKRQLSPRLPHVTNWPSQRWRYTNDVIINIIIIIYRVLPAISRFIPLCHSSR